MAPERITEALHRIPFDIGQAYLWADERGLTLIDAGPLGSGPLIAAAITALGRRTGDLRQIVLTHHHDDHAGGAAEVAGWHGAPVLAHRLDAPVVRGDVPAPPPDLTDAERVLHAQITAGGLPPAPPCEVDRELDDGDELDIGPGAHVVATPGHTDGSIGVHLPAAGVLFTGDTAAHVPTGVVPGVFNLDTALMLASYRRLAALDVQVACFGHGDPIVRDASAALRAALDG